MNIEQRIQDKLQDINSDNEVTTKVKQFTPEEERKFIHSLIIDEDEDEDWTEEDEIKFQRVITRLQR